MTRTVPDHVKDRVKAELETDLSSAVLSQDVQGVFGVVGVDGEDRIVSYWDDGWMYRHPVSDGEVVTDPDADGVESYCPQYSPHSGEKAVLELETEEWKWIHPRYRWVTEDPDS